MTTGPHTRFHKAALTRQTLNIFFHLAKYIARSISTNSITKTMADYKILGLTRNCTEDQVKKAYRELALQNHPDKVGPQGEEKMKAINNAYENVLRNISNNEHEQERCRRYEPHPESWTAKASQPNHYSSSSAHEAEAEPEEIPDNFAYVTETNANFLDYLVRRWNWVDEMNPLIDYYRKLGEYIDAYRSKDRIRHRESGGHRLEREIFIALTELASKIRDMLAKCKGGQVEIVKPSRLEWDVYWLVGKILNTVKQLISYDEADLEKVVELGKTLSVKNMLEGSRWRENGKGGKSRAIQKGWLVKNKCWTAIGIVCEASEDEKHERKYC